MSVSAGHRSRWVAIIVLLACYAMVLFSLGSVFVPASDMPDRPTILNFLVVTAVFVTLPGMGATLAILRPASPIGWLFLTTGLGFVMSIFTTEYVGRALFAGADLPGVVLVDWLGAWMGPVSIGLAIVWIPLLYPDGHLPSRRWRPLAWAAAIAIGVGGIAGAIAPDQAHGYGGQLANPVGVGGAIGELAAVAGSLYLPAIPVLGLFAFVSLFVRFRHSRDVERAQLKWFLFAAGYLVVAMLIAIITTFDLAWYAAVLGLSLLPIAAAVAILRYHLYEIDRLVSRSIAYGLLTGGLIVMFLAVNLALSTTFSSATNVDSVSVAAATLIVAALFTPLRRRVQRVVDRRFDRARYDAERTVAAFSARLRDEVDLAAVTTDLDSTVKGAISPTSVSVWLRTVAR